jgi:hypothetical protein
MDIHDGDYIVGLWFGGAKGAPSSDCLITLLRRKNKWFLEWRFRYHVDGQPFDSKDAKSFYRSTLSAKDYPSEAIVLDKLEIWLSIIKLKYHDLKYYPVRGGIDEFLAVISKQGWAHLKFLKESEL